MFKDLKSVFRIELTLKPKTGFLVSEQSIPLDPSLPDMAFMRTKIGDFETIYVPGSSIKGPIRAFTEYLLRSIEDTAKASCLLGEKSCDKKLNELKKKHKLSAVEKYKRSCLACRTFGNTSLASVVRFDDFYPFEPDLPIEEKKKISERMESTVVVRTGIRINRKEGRVDNRALFNYEAVHGGTFHGTVVLKNPERWQLALVFKALDAAKSGLLRFGRNKSRGMGWLDVEIKRIGITSREPAIVFMEFDGSEFKKVRLDLPGVNFKDRGLFYEAILEREKVKELEKMVTDSFKEDIENALSTVER